MLVWGLKGPVKLIQRVKIAHSFSQSVSNLFHFVTLSMPMTHAYVVLHTAVKDLFGNPSLKMEKYVILNFWSHF